MIRLEVHNFQSIKSVSVEVQGLTVLVGRSNIGKSAMIRAVRAALLGTSGTAFVRHDPLHCARARRGSKTCKCFASVHIVTQGLDLLWEKGDSINRYTVNGAIYDRSGVGSPDFLPEAFQPLHLGDNTMLLQVANQFFPHFLLDDQTGIMTADVLADVAQLDCYNYAIKLVDRDNRTLAATRRVRQQDLEAVHKALEAYTGFDRVQELADMVEGHQERLKVLTEQEGRLSGWVGKTEQLERQIRVLEPVERCVVPDTPIANLWTQYRQVRRYAQSWGQLSAEVTRMSAADTVADFDITGLQARVQQWRSVVRWIRQILSLRDSVQRYMPVAKLPELSVVPLQQAFERYQRVAALLRRALVLRHEISVAQAQVRACEEQEAQLANEYDALGVFTCPLCRRQGHCPTCHTPLLPKKATP